MSISRNTTIFKHPQGTMQFAKFIVFIWITAASINGTAQEDEAMAAFELGKRLFSEQQYEASAEQFNKAYTLKKSWKLLFNIAQAQAAAKRYGLALGAFEKYLSLAGDSISLERRDEVLSEIRSLRDMVGDVKVNGPKGATVWVDGIERGALPLAEVVPVSAGIVHEVMVRDGDDILLTENVRIRSGSEKQITVQLKPKNIPAKAENTAPLGSKTNKREKKFQLAGVLLMGAGAAVALGGGLTGVLAISKHRRLVDDCNGSDCYMENSQELQDKRDALALATDILLPIGLATATAGVILFLLSKKKESESMGRVSLFGDEHSAGLLFQRSF